MASINTKSKSDPIYTHEGAKAVKINNYLKLRRSVACYMLWENQFYEDGIEISKRIEDLIATIDPIKVKELAIEAREKFKLRHTPLFIARCMAKLPEHKKYVSEVLERVIQRPDEIAEYLAIYWKDNKDQPISAQSKKGLAKAFHKFDEYQFGKYNRNKDIRLKDVLFLCHVKPKNISQEQLWKKLIGGYCKNCWENHYDKTTKKVLKTFGNCSNFEEARLQIPDTWETQLSSGADKKETFTRLINEKKLGGMALLRNLRNMIESGVNDDLVKSAIMNMKTERILPFRFITAIKYANKFKNELEFSMFKCLDGHEKLSGKTIFLVDVSRSMDDKISSKSELQRIDAAKALAMLGVEIAEDSKVFTFSNRLFEINNCRGWELEEAIQNSQPHSGTYTGSALKYLFQNVNFDRLILITDEQSNSNYPTPPVGTQCYCINVGSYKNGVGYGDWIHIDGWSEAVIDYILEFEKINKMN